MHLETDRPDEEEKGSVTGCATEDRPFTRRELLRDKTE